MSDRYDSFEWDEAKSERNFALRGLDFHYAARVFRGRVLEEASRRDVSEARFVSIGQVDGIVLTVVWTPRGSARRIMSARRASRKERRLFDGYCAKKHD